MVSGGGMTQSQSGVPANPITTNPLAGVFANMFGIPVSLDPVRGGLVIGDPSTKLRYTGVGEDPTSGFGLADPIFDTSAFSAIRDQLAPTSQIFSPDLISALTGAGVGGLGRTLGMFDESIYPGLEELVTTGLPTDVGAIFGPIRAQAINQLTTETAPNIAQQFAGSASGAFNSDFLAALARAAGGVEANLAAQQAMAQFQASEAAAGRRMEGFPLAAELGAFRTDLPVGFAQDILGLSEAARAEELAARPGARILDLLGALTGLPEATSPGQITKGTTAQGQAGICHVSAEYFGWFTPRWYAARYWILEGWTGCFADAFRGFYLKWGPWLAEVVRLNPEFKKRLRGFFEWCAEEGGG